MNEVQEKIANLRQSGWTVAAIADELGVRPMTVHRWVSGDRYPENAKPVMIALEQIGKRKRIPKRRRYAPGEHHTQRKSQEAED